MRALVVRTGLAILAVSIRRRISGAVRAIMSPQPDVQIKGSVERLEWGGLVRARGPAALGPAQGVPFSSWPAFPAGHKEPPSRRFHPWQVGAGPGP
jgi:hypothetical protein